MISRVLDWYRARRWYVKVPIAGVLGLLALAILYVGGRSLQYLGASKASAGVYAPEDAEIVVRCHDGAGAWSRVQGTGFWKTFRRKMQRDAAVRLQINELLALAGAPTLDQLDDVRYLDEHPMLREESLLRYAGRDLMVAVKRTPKGGRFCAATRLGWREFLLEPGAYLFPGLVGAKKVPVGNTTALKIGGLYVAMRGAVVIASNDPDLLQSSLKRRGRATPPAGAVSAVLPAADLRPYLSGFPTGGFLLFGDTAGIERIRIEADVQGAALVLRLQAEGMRPAGGEAPADVVHMIPASGVGAVVYNIEGRRVWSWVKSIVDSSTPPATPLDQFARTNFRSVVTVMEENGFSASVVPGLDRPVSVVFGATEADDGKTYASTALYLRSSDPVGAAAALQRVIDTAGHRVLKAEEFEIGGMSARAYTLTSDPFGYNNFMAACYAVTSDALVIANHPRFLKETLQCLANQSAPMLTMRHYEDAMRRLAALGLKRVLSPGASASGFFNGPVMREGLEGFYRTLASKAAEGGRAKIRQDLEREGLASGRRYSVEELDQMVKGVENDRIAEKEREYRARGRVLDYLAFVAFQAEPTSDGAGMRIDLAVELK